VTLAGGRTGLRGFGDANMEIGWTAAGRSTNVEVEIG
jgi:hypothetical protein